MCTNPPDLPVDDALRIVAAFELRIHLERSGAVPVGVAQAYADKLRPEGQALLLQYVAAAREANRVWREMGYQQVTH